MRCCTQHHTLACLADVVDYFVAKVGPSARPLPANMATQLLESLSSANPPSRPHGDASSVSHSSAAHTAAMPSPTFSQFVYSNNAVATSSSRSSLGSSGHSDTTSSSPLSPSDNTLSASAAAAVSSVSSSSSQTHAATVENASVYSMNSCHYFLHCRRQA